MYQLDYLGREHANRLRQEAEIQRLAASVRQATGKPNLRLAAGSRIAASTLRWTGRQLSNWGDQLQKQSAELAE